MKNILTQKICRILSGSFAFVFMLSFLRQTISRIDQYVLPFIGNILKYSTRLSLTLYFFFFVLYMLSTWFTSESKTRSVFRHSDSGFIIFLVFFSYYLTFNMVTSQGRAPILLLLFTIVYVLTLLGSSEILLRIRDKKFFEKFYWLNFFKMYAKRKPVILSLTAVLSIYIIYYFLSIADLLVHRIYIYDGSCSIVVSPTSELSVFNNLYLDLGFAISLGALTYLIHFVLYLSHDYEEVNEQKVRAERLKSELITNVSHDMRTPLTSLINYVDLLKTCDISDVNALGYIEVLNKKTQRLNILIQDLLDASKVSSGNIVLEKETINLVEMFGQLIGEYDDDFRASDLTMVYRPNKDNMNVTVDIHQFHRVIDNIMINALKYSLAGTRVFIELCEVDKGISLHMMNTSEQSIEILEDELTEQFIRGDQSRHTEGSGLGLYISKHLIELMGGVFEIKVTGDLFEVYIYLES